jgi:hypothetical protein
VVVTLMVDSPVVTGENERGSVTACTSIEGSIDR